MEASKRQRVDDQMEVEEPAAVVKPSGNLEEEFSEDLLRLYYGRIFPAELMCKWLGYGTQNEKSAADNLLCRREFSFTIAQDVYIRYLSFENADALRKGLCAQLPHKIDIGAVFTADPRDHKKFKLFEPVQREFLIDIDLTDYEFLDCDVKKIETCDRCWPIMALAARALNQILVKDFGFEHLLFVYSGRRGIHCWVCDSRARVMPNDVRSAVADYLSPKLNAATGRLSIAQPMHPSLRRAYDDLLEPFFKETILGCESEGGFGELDKEAGQVRLLDMLGDDDVKARFLESWSRGAGAAQSGLEKWNNLVKHVHSKKNRALSSVLDEIIFSYTFPRLDVNVSKGMNHLLKSPWACHPKTGRVCVPIDAAMADKFEPWTVPTLRTISEDMDKVKLGSNAAPGKEIYDTGLAPYVQYMDRFLSRIGDAARAEKVREITANKQSSLDF